MQKSPAQNQAAIDDQDFVDRVIAEHSGKPGGLLTILERVQDRSAHKYLAPEVLEYIGAKADIPLAQIQSVVTFYALFNLEPQGRNTICVCRGTACHTRGSRGLLERVKLEMGLHRPRRRTGGREALHHHAGPKVHHPHGRLLRTVRAGAGGRDQSRDLRTRERARIAQPDRRTRGPRRAPLAGATASEVPARQGRRNPAERMIRRCASRT